MKSLYILPASPLDSIFTEEQQTTEMFLLGVNNIVKSYTCNFLPCGLELVGCWVVPVDVNRAEKERKNQDFSLTLSGR